MVAGTVDPDEYLVFKPLLDRETLTPVISKEVGGKRSKIVYSESGDGRTQTVEATAQEQADFVLDDREILLLARWATTIENHYGCPMDMEWAKDGESGELWIVQARPETVQARKEASTLRSYRLSERGRCSSSGSGC